MLTLACVMMAVDCTSAREYFMGAWRTKVNTLRDAVRCEAEAIDVMLCGVV